MHTFVPLVTGLALGILIGIAIWMNHTSEMVSLLEFERFKRALKKCNKSRIDTENRYNELKQSLPWLQRD